MPGPSDHLRLTGRRLASIATTATLAGAGLLTVAFAHEAGASNPGKTSDDQALTDDAGAATTAETTPATTAPTTAGAKAGSATTRTPAGQTTPTAPTARSTPSTRAPSATLAPPATAPATVVQRHSHSGGS